jgi:hypothetical protein
MPASEALQYTWTQGALDPLTRWEDIESGGALIGPESTCQQVLARISDSDLFARPIIVTRLARRRGQIIDA